VLDRGTLGQFVQRLRGMLPAKNLGAVSALDAVHECGEIDEFTPRSMK